MIPSSFRNRCLATAGALALSVVAGQALAQTAGSGPIQISAETLEIQGGPDGEPGPMILAGGVQIDRDGARLKADTATYEPDGPLSASGGVVITTPNGGVVFADEVVVAPDMQSGIAKGFATRVENVDFGDGFTPGEVQIAADSAIMVSPTYSQLNKVIYTPCATCEGDGVTPKAPSWSIAADQVVLDQDRHLVYFKDAYFQVKGRRVTPTIPYMFAPDQTAPRTSGLLPPQLDSRRHGLNWEQRYYQVLSRSADLTFGPQISTNLNPFLNLDLRKRFWSGTTETRAGYTYEQDIEPRGLKFGPETSRSYLLASGDFHPIDDWRLGYTAERVSDPFLFDKYGQSDVFVQRGLYAADDHRLISQAYAVRQTPLSYFSASAISIQGLRPTDFNRTFPVIAPLIEARFEPHDPILGGRLRVVGSAVSLVRQQAVSLTNAPPPPAPGIDSRRASLNFDWRRTDTLPGGLRLSPFVLARGDIYALNDLPAPSAKSINLTQGQASLGVDLTDPLIRRGAASTTILEPMLQGVLATRADIDPRIPNEDSQVLEFDETNLMSPDKFSGYDRYIGGPQLNVGVRVTTNFDSGKVVSGLIGRSFADDGDAALYPTRSGLADHASDWIAAIEAAPRRNMTLFARARFDADDGSLRRIEAGIDLKNSHTNGYIRYLRDDQDATGQERQDLDLNIETKVSDHWGVSAYAVRDLEGSGWRRRDLGFYYQDDCLRFDVVYRHRDEFTNTAAGAPSVRPASSLTFGLTLATLGNTR
ncbi:MAG: organic solvent tolerance protein [Caulobacteraceae bacterium]|nr:organic solvent tolerance protein [Caulobacteraceae bacterium]